MPAGWVGVHVEFKGFSLLLAVEHPTELLYAKSSFCMTSYVASEP
jgi:hypothetical protein